MRPDGTTSSRAKMRATALIVRWFASTPHRTFIVYPAVVVLFAVAIRREQPIVNPWGAPLLVWGYLQYRFVGLYRVRAGGGGPGTDVPPVRLVMSGPLYVGNCLVNKHTLLSSEENGEPLTSLWPMSPSGRLGPVFQAPLFRLDGILGRA
jgi:hypothetical protein